MLGDDAARLAEFDRVLGLDVHPFSLTAVR
jgi:hypothetical protein